MDDGREPDEPSREDPASTPLSAIILYVFGFMGALALLAWVLARLLRRG